MLTSCRGGTMLSQWAKICIILWFISLFHGSVAAPPSNSKSNSKSTPAQPPTQKVGWGQQKAIESNTTMPKFIKFQATDNTDQFKLSRLVLALEDLMHALQFVLHPPPGSEGSFDTVYPLYFMDDRLSKLEVRKVFQKILGDNQNRHKLGGDFIHSVVVSNMQEDGQHCGVKQGVKEAAFVRTTSERQEITFCTEAFHYWVLGEKSCDEVEDVMEDKMTTLTSLMLHELLHLKAVGDEVIKEHIGDIEYGPYDVRKLREFRKMKTFANADSYTWLFLQAYWTQKCKRNFAAPDIEESFHEKEPNYWTGPKVKVGI